MTSELLAALWRGEVHQGEDAARFDPNAVLAVRLIGLAALFGSALVVITADRDRGVALLMAITVAALSAGLGFLFGLPRLAAESAAARAGDGEGGAEAAQRPTHASLEQVADWLTKILLGAGLTQLEPVKKHTIKFADWIASCGPAGSDALLGRVFGLGVIGYFFVVGFLFGYLATRLLVVRLLANEDELLGRLRARAAKIGERRGMDLALADINLNLVSRQTPQGTELSDTNRDAVAQAQKWQPAAPRSGTPDDPQKGRFGGKSAGNGRFITAQVLPKPGATEVFDVVLQVESSDKARPLDGPVKFFLHDSFAPDAVVVVPKDGVATLKLLSWGAFTVGAMLDDGKTLLEIDLAELGAAPQKFRER